ncbi:MAG: LPS-assembly protein LptD, partial [Kiritimatiellae bacterium]|nr:LPS-assembly protein LptD [Kiritimatiellia bacterium]
MQKNDIRRWWALAWMLTGGWAVCTAEAQTRGTMTVTPATRAEADQPVDIQADTMEQRGVLLLLRDNVRIRQGAQLLTARYVQYNRETGDAHARGGVTFLRADGSLWQGEEFTYNFKSGVGDFGGFEFTSGPYRVFGSESTTETVDMIRVKDVIVTTCKGDPPWEFEVHMSEATLRDRRYLTGHNAVMYLGPVPVMWIPWYRRDLDSNRRWDIIPGFSSRLGAFLLVHYNYPLSDDSETLRAKTGLNFYSRRGVGLLHDFYWNQSSGPGQSAVGSWENFIIQDREIYRSDQQREEREAFLTDDTRYRVRLKHTQTLGDRQWLYADGTYLSDPYVNLDFFRRDYRQQPQPENRATFQHRGDVFNASIQLNARLNDFYHNVDRLPEGRLGILPVEIGDTGIFYESDSTASFLRRRFPSNADDEEYDSTRVDTYHMLTYPGRYFGFLGLTPRAGYRATFYSDSRGEDLVTTNLVTRVDDLGQSFVTNEVSRTAVFRGADSRHLPELGLEANFKAFGVLDEGPNQWGSGIRHVIEPYSNYTWMPEPDLRPPNILQFDSIDRIDRNHSFAFGLRNKIQTRRPQDTYVNYESYQSPRDIETTFDAMEAVSLEELPDAGRSISHDLVRTDISTFYRLDTYPEQDDLGPVVFDVELRPGTAVRWRTRGEYDVDASEISRLENQLSLRGDNATTFTLNHIYRPDSRNTVAALL